MVYIYKKIVRGKPYYYLRISKRVKGKTVVKDIAYLGSDAAKINSKLDKLPSAYKKEIRKAYRNIKRFIESEHYLNKARKLKLKEDLYLDKKNLEDIESIKMHFNENFLRRDESIIEETYKNFLIEFAFNTTSLEGNTITLEEANRLLKEDLTPKNKTLREVYDLQNTEKVFFEIIDLRERIDHNFIIDVHDKLLERIDVRKGYRNHDIKVFKSHFEATPAVYIKTDMDILLKWLKNEKKLHPLVLAGIFHHKFERIHPFSDGNGRTGRILMNYMLLQKEYPPIIIRKSKRGDYLDAMSSGDKADLKGAEPKHYRKLINYLAEEMILSYWNNFLV